MGCRSCCRSLPTRSGGAERRSSSYANSASTFSLRETHSTELIVGEDGGPSRWFASLTTRRQAILWEQASLPRARLLESPRPILGHPARRSVGSPSPRSDSPPARGAGALSVRLPAEAARLFAVPVQVAPVARAHTPHWCARWPRCWW